MLLVSPHAACATSVYVLSGLRAAVVMVFDSDKMSLKAEKVAAHEFQGAVVVSSTEQNPLLCASCSCYFCCCLVANLPKAALLVAVAIFGSFLSAVTHGSLLLALWCWNHMSPGPAAHQVRLFCCVQTAAICGAWAVCHTFCDACFQTAPYISAMCTLLGTVHASLS